MYPNINNECRFDGRMTKDPELKFIPINGGEKQLARAKFTIAVDKNMTKQQKEQAKAKGESTVDFVPCELVGPKAEVVAQYFPKGKPIKVTAVFRSYNYINQQGEKVYSYCFDVTDFGFATIDYTDTNNQDARNTMNNNFNYSNDMFASPIDDGDMPF